MAISSLFSIVSFNISKDIVSKVLLYLYLYIEGFNIKYLGFKYSLYLVYLLYSYYTYIVYKEREANCLKKEDNSKKKYINYREVYIV